ncbi:MAG: ABC transporter permease [Acidobacteria bacterium]|nr:ABC transporter permease [Acidobacteriota bacterium]
MNFTDIISLALRNLRQARLRTSLTVIGVIVGVAAIVTMVSFGLGLQNNILKDAFSRIDFFTSITVFGPGADAIMSMRDGGEASNGQRNQDTASSESRPVLDDKAIEELRKLDGVRYVYPNFSFESFVRFEGRTRRTGISGAPTDVEYNPRFRDFIAGRHIAGADAPEVVITERFMTRMRTAGSARRSQRRGPGDGPFQTLPEKTEAERKRLAEEVIGKTLTILTLPSGPESTESSASVFGVPLLDLPVQSEEAGDDGQFEGADDGLLSQLERHNYTIVGVLKAQEGVNLNIGSGGAIFIPMEHAGRFRAANRPPLERLGEMLAGDIGYQSAEVRVTDLARVETIKDQIKKMGFNFWNIGNQIEEIKRVFLIINASLALIGGIALLVASFGISNTMIMSIRERTREIGVMKAIGGSDSEIMRIFFVEASLIGLTGGVLGVLGGWGIDRIANLLANRWITQQAGQAIRQVEFFSIPWYLSGGAILFAVLVSLVAAVYPAMSAARVDPIKALRYE